MHPILAHRRRWMLYLAAWLAPAALLGTLLSTTGGIRRLEAAALSVPLCSFIRAKGGVVIETMADTDQPNNEANDQPIAESETPTAADLQEQLAQAQAQAAEYLDQARRAAAELSVTPEPSGIDTPSDKSAPRARPSSSGRPWAARRQRCPGRGTARPCRGSRRRGSRSRGTASGCCRCRRASR